MKSGIGQVWSIIVVVFFSAMLIRMFVVDSFVVSGNSMAPALLDGDYVFINKRSYFFSSPERFDIVAVDAPEGPAKKFIKRVVGLPKERVEISDGLVRIKKSRIDEGEILSEPYISVPTPIDTIMNLDPQDYFLMGDNRLASTDSRQLGAFTRRLIEGKLLFHVSPKRAAGRLNATISLFSRGLKIGN